MKLALCALVMVFGVGTVSGQTTDVEVDSLDIPLSRFSIGLSGGFDPSSNRFSYICETSWFDHDSVGEGFMLGAGFGIKFLEAQAPVSYLLPHRFSNDTTFSTKEYDNLIAGLLSLNLGYYFESGIGVSVVGGIAITPKVTLESSPLRPGHFWERSSRMAIDPLYGGTLSYRLTPALAMRAGYVQGQGVILGYTLAQFQPLAIRKILDTIPRRFPYIGLGATYGGLAGGWGIVIEQGQLTRDSVDGSAWGSGVEIGLQVTPASVPSHLQRPFAYSGLPITTKRYSEATELSVCLNDGGYFANGFGIFPTIGLSMGSRVTLKYDEGSPTSPYEDSRETVFFFVFGGQLRYMIGDTQLHAGYTNRRGAHLAFSVRNFLTDLLLGEKSKLYYE